LLEEYAENVGFVIGSGCRNKKLLGHFDSPEHATGFGLRIDRLIEALHMKEEPCVIDAVIFSIELRALAIAFANVVRM
ncbi:ATP phosphoribosyltransferase regulatory subunit, partial [Bacillus subtilis]|nr:ATP phosphoribosyltransferase regulatory subunit [Bacillus subtilis]